MMGRTDEGWPPDAASTAACPQERWWSGGGWDVSNNQTPSGDNVLRPVTERCWLPHGTHSGTHSGNGTTQRHGTDLAPDKVLDEAQHFLVEFGGKYFILAVCLAGMDPQRCSPPVASAVLLTKKGGGNDREMTEEKKGSKSAGKWEHGRPRIPPLPVLCTAPTCCHIRTMASILMLLYGYAP